MIRNRRYRNRRIGEFLKELQLTEGKGTGIPTMIRALKDNGSPEPKFDTNEPERSSFITELLIHPAYIDNKSIGGQVGGQVGGQAYRKHPNLTKRQQEILELINENPSISRSQLAKKLNINESAIQKHISALKKKKYIERSSSTTGYWEIKS